MRFDYEGEKVLVNTASHRPKCEWIRKIYSNDFAGQSQEPLPLGADQMHGGKRTARVGARRRIRDQTARPHLAQVYRPIRPLRPSDLKIDEKRVLFVCGIDRIATFGEPAGRERLNRVADRASQNTIVGRRKPVKDGPERSIRGQVASSRIDDLALLRAL